jgi:hypothetical protein
MIITTGFEMIASATVVTSLCPTLKRQKSES